MWPHDAMQRDHKEATIIDAIQPLWLETTSTKRIKDGSSVLRVGGYQTQKKLKKFYWKEQRKGRKEEIAWEIS